MKVHPAAELFPLLSDDRLHELAESIRSDGLQHPIVTWNGFLIDGRNREAACNLAGVTPRYKELSGNEEAAVALVARENLQRRDLGASVRAAIVAQMSDLVSSVRKEAAKRLRDAGLSSAPGRPARNLASAEARFPDPVHVDDELAAKAGVSRSTMQRVRRIQREDPDLFKEVAKGKATAYGAETKMRKPSTSPSPTSRSVAHVHEVMLRLAGSAHALDECDLPATVAAANEDQVAQWVRSLRELGSALSPLRAALAERKEA